MCVYSTTPLLSMWPLSLSVGKDNGKGNEAVGGGGNSGATVLRGDVCVCVRGLSGIDTFGVGRGGV